METMKNLIKPKPTPQQQLRDWQRRLRQECRNVERQIRGKPLTPFTDVQIGIICHVEREERSVQKAIKDAAKRNDMASAKRMVGEWMMDPIKIPWFRHLGSSWSLVYLVRGGSRPNLTEGSSSAAMGCFVQGYLVDRG
ncbi:hypothetical protein M5K25_022072 [Dendrobium thyrsiflorum]|uniref:Uncharacterized protein n=1 Tax=Dendrobium thyrsiflorum TaxID=117978 RepID=A0ABD0U5J1_DENTH